MEKSQRKHSTKSKRKAPGGICKTGTPGGITAGVLLGKPQRRNDPWDSQGRKFIKNPSGGTYRVISVKQLLGESLGRNSSRNTKRGTPEGIPSAETPGIIPVKELLDQFQRKNLLFDSGGGIPT